MPDAVGSRRFGPVRAALLVVFRRIATVYFREIEVCGAIPSKDAGGRLFAANHVNGLVDPILVLTQTPCAISPVAKSTLWKIPGIKWLLEAADAVPIVRRRDDPTKSAGDNEAVFERVAAHLGSGGNILIFPEGTSHNEPHLLALRSGAGRMLARASAAPGVDLTFQAVALEFDARDVFRSRALVLFGPVRNVASLGPSDDLARRVTDVLQEDLSELLVEGATWEERVLIARVADMFANDAAASAGDAGDAVARAKRLGREHALEHLNTLGRRVEQARRVLTTTAPDTVATTEQRLREYFADLDDASATDALVARHPLATSLAARNAADGAHDDRVPSRVASAAALVLAFPLAVLGAILYWLPYQLPRLVTARIKGDPDTASTYKLGVGLVVFPAWAGLLVTLAVLRLPHSEAALAAAILVASPFAALPWLDRWDRLPGRMRVLGPSENRREDLDALAEKRATLMRDLEAARAQAEDA